MDPARTPSSGSVHWATSQTRTANPTGTIIPAEGLAAIADVCRARGIRIPLEHECVVLVLATIPHNRTVGRGWCASVEEKKRASA